MTQNAAEKCTAEIAGLANGPLGLSIIGKRFGRAAAIMVAPFLGNQAFDLPSKQPCIIANMQSFPGQRDHTSGEAHAWHACGKRVAVFEQHHRMQRHTHPIYGRPACAPVAGNCRNHLLTCFEYKIANVPRVNCRNCWGQCLTDAPNVGDTRLARFSVSHA